MESRVKYHHKSGMEHPNLQFGIQDLTGVVNIYVEKEKKPLLDP